MAVDRRIASLFMIALICLAGAVTLFFPGCGSTRPPVARLADAGPRPRNVEGNGQPGHSNAAPAEHAGINRELPVGMALAFVGDELTRRAIVGAKVHAETQIWQTIADGTATIPRSENKDSVRVQAEGYEDRTATLQGERTEIWLTPSLRGHGMVVDAAGRGVMEAGITSQSAVAPQNSSPVLGGKFDVRSSQDGSFSFPISSVQRHFVARTRSGLCGWQVVQPGETEIVIRVASGAALEVIVEGPRSYLASVACFEINWGMASSSQGSAIEPAQVLLTNGRAKVEGLPALSQVAVSFPGIPGLWETSLGTAGKCTRLLVVLDDSVFKLALKWSGRPPHPIAAISISRHTTANWHQVGKIIDQENVEIPASIFPLTSGLQMRFLDERGRVAGFASTSSIRGVGPGVLECDAWPARRVSGRTIDNLGKPVSGALVYTSSTGRTAMREGRTLSDDQGHFQLDIDDRFELQLTAAWQGRVAECLYSSGTATFGDIVLGFPATVSVTLRHGGPGAVYFVSVSKTQYFPGWPPPVGCRTDETIRVPVRAGSTDIVVASSRRVIHWPLKADVDSYEIDLREGESALTVRLVDPFVSRRVPGVSLWVGTAGLSPMTPQGRAGMFFRATTDENGEAFLTGLTNGRIRITLVPNATGNYANHKECDVTHAGQLVIFEVAGLVEPEAGYVQVIGTVAPVPTSRILRLVATQQPLPKFMNGRELKAAGIKAAIVYDVKVVGGTYTAMVHSSYPYLAVAISEESDPLLANAGFLVSTGDIWRGDLSLPIYSVAYQEATLVLDAGQDASLSAPRVRVLWLEGGSIASRDFSATVNRPLRISWPAHASRVWVTASRQQDGKTASAIKEAVPGAQIDMVLRPMPEVRLNNREAISGRVSLTPLGMTRREWVNALGGKLELLGLGEYEFAGVDQAGKLRTKVITVLDGKDVLELDARSVLIDP